MKKSKIELIFLGTSADPSMPIAFCECVNCKLARNNRKKNLRKRSSVMINSELLIDLGPDVQTATFMHKCSLSNIKYCLITHPHSDHFDVSQIIARKSDYGVVIKNKLKIIGSIKTIKILKEIIRNNLPIDYQSDEKLCNILKIQFEEIEKSQEIMIGDYKVKAYLANHDIAIGSLLYKIIINNVSIFYGLDTSDFDDETWNELINDYFDIVILDHTYGIGYKGTDHLSAESFVKHIIRMGEHGIIDKKSRIIASHFSHEGIMEYQLLKKYAKKNKYEIAFDGMKIKI